MWAIIELYGGALIDIYLYRYKKNAENMYKEKILECKKWKSVKEYEMDLMSGKVGEKEEYHLWDLGIED